MKKYTRHPLNWKLTHPINKDGRVHLSRLMIKPTQWVCAQRRLRSTWAFALTIRPVWSESSLSAWRKLGSLATYWAHSEDSDQTGRMPRLIWVFAGRTFILLVLPWGGSFGRCLLAEFHSLFTTRVFESSLIGKATFIHWLMTLSSLCRWKFLSW